MTKQVNYFLTAHTSNGLANHVKESLTHLKKVLVVEHPSVHWTTIILNELIKQDDGENHELILSSSGEAFLEGVILPESSVAVVTDTFAISYSDWLPDAKSYRPNVTRLNVNETERKEYIAEYFTTLQQAYRLMRDGLSKHEAVEEIYINEINGALADDLAKRLISELLEKVVAKKDHPVKKQRFFGTNTPFGTYNIVPSLLERVNRADLIHGRAGTGKSTLMKKMATAIMEYGYSIEVYYCSFDPDSVDMILAPELDYCIMDATDPHAFHPERKGERIIDTYAEFVTPGTDEKYSEQIQSRTAVYKERVKQGKNLMQQAGALFTKIEEPFVRNEQILTEQLEEIVQYIENKLNLD